MFKRILTGILILLWSLSGKAQQIYQTREGSSVVTALYKNNKVIAQSNQLLALINYETAEIELILNPSSLQTTTDSLNVKLLNSTIGTGILKGKLNIPYVSTLKHPDHKLNFEAVVHLNGITKQIYVTGDLKHIASNGAISCLLTLSVQLELDDFGVNLPEGWGNEITIQITQTVLKKANQ
jgi:hypothetical protein